MTPPPPQSPGAPMLRITPPEHPQVVAIRSGQSQPHSSLSLKISTAHLRGMSPSLILPDDIMDRSRTASPESALSPGNVCRQPFTTWNANRIHVERSATNSVHSETTCTTMDSVYTHWRSIWAFCFFNLWREKGNACIEHSLICFRSGYWFLCKRPVTINLLT